MSAAVVMTDEAQSCRTCRWRLPGKAGRLECSLRRRPCRATDGRNCHLWDPIGREKLPPRLQVWASISLGAQCEHHCDPTEVGHLLQQLRASMRRMGIDTGADEFAWPEEEDK